MRILRLMILARGPQTVFQPRCTPLPVSGIYDSAFLLCDLWPHFPWPHLWFAIVWNRHWCSVLWFGSSPYIPTYKYLTWRSRDWRQQLKHARKVGRCFHDFPEDHFSKQKKTWETSETCDPDHRKVICGRFHEAILDQAVGNFLKHTWSHGNGGGAIDNLGSLGSLVTLLSL